MVYYYSSLIENSIWQVLRVFFDDPNPKSGFTIRWISKQIRLAPISVKLHLDRLLKFGLVIRDEKTVSYPTYWANKASEKFRFYKKMDVLFRLEESGLVEYLSRECNPLAIVLFGSAARGEDDRFSDIDLFLIAKERKLNLSLYEAKLKRRIQLHFTTDMAKIPKELRNNVVNGIILKGYLKVF